MQSAKRMFFAPYKPHIGMLPAALGRTHQVFAANPGHDLPATVQSCVVHKHAYGLLSVREWLGGDFQPPIALSGLKGALKQTTPEVIVCFDIYHWYTLDCFAFKRANPETKLIIYAETKRWPKHPFSRVMLKRFLRYAKSNKNLIDSILVYTEDGKDFFNQELPGVPVKILPAPVDTKRFVPTQRRDWLPNDTLRILLNARYAPYKRHEDVLQAVAKLKQEGKRCVVTCIGRADTGRPRVERLVKEMGLESKVTFLDPLPTEKMPELYHQHDVLVLPSYNEAIGMVVPEAMACGLPTITSDTVGANVYVKDGETGWVHPTGDVPALTAALRECFDPAELERRGNAARKRVEENFSVPAIAERFLALVDALS